MARSGGPDLRDRIRSARECEQSGLQALQARPAASLLNAAGASVFELSADT